MIEVTKEALQELEGIVKKEPSKAIRVFIQGVG
jgi:Fe-S cluster assembly iron-binding protein IscA